MSFTPNFCTLFDQNYLDKALAMIHSLQKHCPKFHLYCFTFDDLSSQLIEKLQLKDVSIITLKQLETTALHHVKTKRNPKEYCWTATPFTLKYCIEILQLNNCTYLDADLFFFSDPTPLFPDTPWATLITPHRYTPKYDASQVSGTYCVQWVSFQNTKESLKILNEWAENCLDWCYEIPENDKFGDQKYLDSWPKNYHNVISLEDPGIGLAPWNMQQYDVYKCSKNKLKLRTKNKNKSLILFFHFHHIITYAKNLHFLGDYPIPKQTYVHCYLPYLTALQTATQTLKKLNFHQKRKQPKWDQYLLAKVFQWFSLRQNWIIP